MDEIKTREPIELTDAELDAVSGGGIFGNSLVAISNVLNHDLNNNHVSVAANVGVLSGILGARSA